MADVAADTPRFKRKERVVTTRELRGVPAGTEGTVMIETGLTWFRYRVRFDNGVEMGSLDGHSLARVSR